MTQSSQILENIDHIIEDLAKMRKALHYLKIGKTEESKKIWEETTKTSWEVKSDDVSTRE